MVKCTIVKNFILNIYMNELVLYLSYIVFIFVIFLIALTLSVQLYLYIKPKTIESFDSVSCKNLDRKYKTSAKISSTVGSSNKNYKLKDFYVKTAYNCAALENNVSGKVDTCAIKNCLMQGYRCLDFELFSSLNEKNKLQCVVGMSEQEGSFNTISSSNTLELSEVFRFLRSYAFSDICPNSNDPCILHLRIKSTDKSIINIIVNEIKTFLHDKLLPIRYGFAAQNYENQIGNVELQTLANKFILLVNAPELELQNSSLYEYSNGITGSEKTRLYYYDELNNANRELIEFNRINMTYVLPTTKNKLENNDFGVAKMNGCQFNGMSVQNKDQHIDSYNNYFDNNNYAFVLKPESLRSFN